MLLINPLLEGVGSDEVALARMVSKAPLLPLGASFSGKCRLESMYISLSAIIKNFSDFVPPYAEGLLGSDGVAYRNLKSAFDDHKVTLKGFNSFDISLSEFDWKSIDSDRNWWWQMQALPFLNWYLGSFLIQTGAERRRYFFLCISAIDRWREMAAVGDSPLLWHDHATAFRVRSLANWLIFTCQFASEWLDDQADHPGKIENAILEHVQWLCEEKNYSKHTNHGFDQALIVYQISLLFPGVGRLVEAGMVAKGRLLDELDFAFTEEGVHVENSPGYQLFMLERVRLLGELRGLGDHEISASSAAVIDKVRTFLNAITLPDGSLPLIGDTKGSDRWEHGGVTDGIKFFDYTKSGYFVAKGVGSSGESLHLVFKCSHRSHYHRHDDDLSIHLYWDGETVLGDGGLGFYQEKDARRVFVRGAGAHNTRYPLNEVAERRVASLMQPPRMGVDDGSIVWAETSCWGGRLRREVDISSLKDGRVVLKDFWLEWPSDAEAGDAANFFLPYPTEVVVSGPTIKFLTPNGRRVSVLREGCVSEVYVKAAACSLQYGKFSEATVFGWRRDAGLGREVLAIELSAKPA